MQYLKQLVQWCTLYTGGNRSILNRNQLPIQTLQAPPVGSQRLSEHTLASPSVTLSQFLNHFSV